MNCYYEKSINADHTVASPEFVAYPAQCIKGTSEGEIVDEIKEIGGYTLITKNSITKMKPLRRRLKWNLLL